MGGNQGFCLSVNDCFFGVNIDVLYFPPALAEEPDPFFSFLCNHLYIIIESNST